jgi:hypothetical protein
VFLSHPLRACLLVPVVAAAVVMYCNNMCPDVVFSLFHIKANVVTMPSPEGALRLHACRVG